MRDLYKDYRINEPFNKSEMPHPIFEDNPDYIELYWKAWELAWSHVLLRDDVPQKKYIDEAMKPDRIWIWDTCFMALFCKYAPHVFPGVESLNNFYYVMHDGQKLPFKIHHPDNPPLFAWVEYENFKFTGDVARLKWLLLENQYLQKSFDFIENSQPKKLYNYAGVWLTAKKTERGYKWSGVQSGMDNTPRARGKYNKILWIDLISQQALAAEKIAQMAEIIEDQKIKSEYLEKYNELCSTIRKYYWDDKDGFYYDISAKKKNKFHKVRTPASFWTMLSGAATPEQASEMIKKIQDPNILGGLIPFTSVSRNDRNFDPKGQYWRGGVWLPTSYMSIKALERYGFENLADECAEATVSFILKVYRQVEPHTIWEAYSPTKYEPSTYKKNLRVVRPDFCGWSALGPISLFIENILGIREIDAFNRKIIWDIHNRGKHGIENLKFGDITTDLVYKNNEVKIKSNKNYNIELNGKIYVINQGSQSIKL